MTDGIVLPKRRNPFLVWLVWPILTLGIYFLVWYYKINKEIAETSRDQSANPLVSLLAVSIGSFIIVPPFVSVYQCAERINNAQRAAGLQPTCNGWIGIILMFVFNLWPLYYQMEINKVVDTRPGVN